MNLKFPLLAVVICLLTSCNDQQQESATSKPSAKMSTTNCYRYINDNDTVILKTINIDGSVTGTLVYNFYQKDKNKGPIQGQMKGEILFANYTFVSERIQSVKPIAFKEIDNKFIEGYGETEKKNGKTTFKEADSLNFSHSIILSQFDCEK